MPDAVEKTMRSRARALFSASTLAIIVLALAGAPSIATAAQGSNHAAVRASVKSEVVNYLHTQKPVQHISGVSLRATFPGDKPSINLSVGTTRYDGGEPLSKTNLWQIGSNTKAFTSVMLLQLEAEHKLSIHDTVGKWLPKYRAWRNVTIKHLLNMTSGIPEYLDPDFGFFDAYAADPNTEFSSRRLVSYVIDGESPDGYYYSNTNYILAGMILEKATDDTYARQLRKRIIKPLGLRTLTYSTRPYPNTFTDRLPAGYFTASPVAHLVNQDMRRYNLSYAGSAGGIVSSLKDATKWERALYNGRMLPGKQQRELESLVSERCDEPSVAEKCGKPIERPTAKDPLGYGLGVEALASRALGDDFGVVWQYEGQTFGYLVYHVYLPRSGTLLAVAVNSSGPGSASADFVGLDELASSVLQVLHTNGAA